MCVRIAELRESLGEYAAGFDAALLSAEQAEVVVEQASRIEKAAATLKALAAARLAETGCWKTAGDRSAAHQLARRTGTTVVAAAGVIDTARRLQALPQTSAAARRGELSFEQASAIAQAAGVDPGSEGALLQTARCSPLAELREQCGRARAAAADDPEARRARIHQRRSLRSFTDAEGQWHLHSRNNPEVGAAIMAALDPFREAVFRRARSEARREPPEAYAADALAEMARCSGNGDLVPPAGTGLRAAVTRAEPEVGPGGGAVAEAEGGPGGAARAEPEVGPGAETGAETGAEAGGAPEIGPEVGPGGEGAAEVGAEVGAEAEGAAAGRASRPPNGRRAGPPKIIVRVDLGALLRGRPVEGEVCEIAGFGPVAVSAVHDMIDSEDPFLTAVVTRGAKLLGVAHLGRRPNATQQTALQWLYPSCANGLPRPGPARLRHRVDWARSHLTVLDLLDRLCGHCHALETRQDWSLVEGRGKRALVAPDDSRHPRNAVQPKANGPPGS